MLKKTRLMKFRKNRYLLCSLIGIFQLVVAYNGYAIHTPRSDQPQLNVSLSSLAQPLGQPLVQEYTKQATPTALGSYIRLGMDYILYAVYSVDNKEYLAPIITGSTKDYNPDEQNVTTCKFSRDDQNLFSSGTSKKIPQQTTSAIFLIPEKTNAVQYYVSLCKRIVNQTELCSEASLNISYLDPSATDSEEIFYGIKLSFKRNNGPFPLSEKPFEPEPIHTKLNGLKERFTKEPMRCLTIIVNATGGRQPGYDVCDSAVFQEEQHTNIPPPSLATSSNKYDWFMWYNEKTQSYENTKWTATSQVVHFYKKALRVYIIQQPEDETIDGGTDELISKCQKALKVVEDWEIGSGSNL